MKKRNYRITTKTGAQLKIKKLDGDHLNTLAYKATIKLRRAMYHFLEVRREVKRRRLEHPAHMANCSPYEITTTSLALAMNDFNHKYKAEDDFYDNEDEEE